MIAYNCREGTIVLAVNSKQKKRESLLPLRRCGFLGMAISGGGEKERIIDSYL